MRILVFIAFGLVAGCELSKPAQHEPGQGNFPGIPNPTTTPPEDVQISEDGGQASTLDHGFDAGVGDTSGSEVTLTLLLRDPRDGSPIPALSLMPSGGTSPSDAAGTIEVSMPTNEPFALACTGTGFAPTWLAGSLGGQSTDLTLSLLPESGLDQLLGSIGVLQDPAKANLLVRITDKLGGAASGAKLSHSPESGLGYVITGPTAVVGDTVLTTDTETLGLANINPGVVTISVTSDDGTPCSVQPGGGDSLPLTLSLGATGSLSFLCP